MKCSVGKLAFTPREHLSYASYYDYFSILRQG